MVDLFFRLVRPAALAAGVGLLAAITGSALWLRADARADAFRDMRASIEALEASAGACIERAEIERTISALSDEALVDRLISGGD